MAARPGAYNDGDTMDQDFDPDTISNEFDEFAENGNENQRNENRIPAGIVEDDFDDEDGLTDPPPQSRENGPQPQRRGPRPGFMGQGRMGQSDMAQLVENFWESPQQNSRAQTPQQQFYAQLVDKLESLTSGGDRSQPGNQVNNDEGWEAFLNQRDFAPNMAEFSRRFNEAGNDPVKTQSVMRDLMQATARSTYRAVATDMQNVVQQMFQRVVPAMLDDRMKLVNSEQTYAALRARVINRNPQYGTAQFGPVLDQVLAQALTLTNGNSDRAMNLAENFLATKMPGRNSNNRGNNRGNSGAIDWTRIANSSRR